LCEDATDDVARDAGHLFDELAEDIGREQLQAPRRGLRSVRRFVDAITCVDGADTRQRVEEVVKDASHEVLGAGELADEAYALDLGEAPEEVVVLLGMDVALLGEIAELVEEEGKDVLRRSVSLPRTYAEIRPRRTLSSCSV
jgi:hypothetical protein